VQIGILESTDFSSEALEILKCSGPVEFFSDQSLSNFIQYKDVLFIRLGYLIDFDFLRKAPNLWSCGIFLLKIMQEF